MWEIGVRHIKEKEREPQRRNETSGPTYEREEEERKTKCKRGEKKKDRETRHINSDSSMNMHS